eukprot:TRINITY_DN24539_c0_g1_i1.p1 TRINITY_DN24539_c0_g1~~TRINITY_DN24539_c0_g1_i1.p1  ORF type:complete len:986 (+),score=274.38 TRINITY_DN24539_c0_g1_i1:71-3028(+)
MAAVASAVAEIVRAVQQLHHGNTGQRQEADAWLQKMRDSPEAWDPLCAALADSSLPVPVLHFAAVSLRTKVAKGHAVAQLPAAARAQLAPALLQQVVRYCAGPAPVRTQLCLAVAALAGGTDDGQDVVAILPPCSALGNSAQTLPVLTELLTLLGEEAAAKEDAQKQQAVPAALAPGLWSPPDSPASRSLLGSPLGSPSSPPLASERRPLLPPALALGPGTAAAMLAAEPAPAGHPLVASARSAAPAVAAFLQQQHQQQAPSAPLLRCLARWLRFDPAPAAAIAQWPLCSHALDCLCASPQQCGEEAAEAACELARLSQGCGPGEMPIVSLLMGRVGDMAAAFAKAQADQDDGASALLTRTVSAMAASYISVIAQAPPEGVALANVLAVCAEHSDTDVACETFPFWARLASSLRRCRGEERRRRLAAYSETLARAMGAVVGHARVPDDADTWLPDEEDDFRRWRGDALSAVARDLAELMTPLGALSHAAAGCAGGGWQGAEVTLWLARCLRLSPTDAESALPQLLSAAASLPMHWRLNAAIVSLVGDVAWWIRGHPELLAPALRHAEWAFDAARGGTQAARCVTLLCRECPEGLSAGGLLPLLCGIACRHAFGAGGGIAHRHRCAMAAATAYAAARCPSADAHAEAAAHCAAAAAVVEDSLGCDDAEPRPAAVAAAARLAQHTLSGASEGAAAAGADPSGAWAHAMMPALLPVLERCILIGSPRISDAAGPAISAAVTVAGSAGVGALLQRLRPGLLEACRRRPHPGCVVVVLALTEAALPSLQRSGALPPEAAAACSFCDELAAVCAPQPQATAPGRCSAALATPLLQLAVRLLSVSQSTAVLGVAAAHAALAATGSAEHCSDLLRAVRNCAHGVALCRAPALSAPAGGLSVGAALLLAAFQQACAGRRTAEEADALRTAAEAVTAVIGAAGPAAAAMCQAAAAALPPAAAPQGAAAACLAALAGEGGDADRALAAVTAVSQHS